MKVTCDFVTQAQVSRGLGNRPDSSLTEFRSIPGPSMVLRIDSVTAALQEQSSITHDNTGFPGLASSLQGT